MASDKDKGTKNLGKADINLWKAMTRDVDPLQEGAVYQDAKEQPSTPPKKKKTQNKKPEKQNDQRIIQSPRSKEMDKNTLQKLKKGQIPIDARLDLHGYNQGDAKVALTRFILGAYEQGKRCLLVITGHGQRQKQTGDGAFWDRAPAGILKKRLPDWLSDDALDDIVLKIIPAQAKHGGAGAFYIYLRKQK